MRIQIAVRTLLFAVVLSAAGCSPASSTEPTTPPGKSEPGANEPVEPVDDKPQEPPDSPPDSLSEPARPVPDDIGYPDAPYPSDSSGELLWQDDFSSIQPEWHQVEGTQPRLETEGEHSIAVFDAAPEQHSSAELTFQHPRNVIYQLTFQIPRGFSDIIFTRDPMTGSQAVLTCFGKEDRMTFRLLLRTGHEAPLQQLIEFTSPSENGWHDLEIRQYDRYVDLFVNGRHGFSFKMPDDMLLDQGSLTLNLYHPFGEEARMNIDTLTIYEALPENVFLDTLPLTAELDRSQQTMFSSLPFEPVHADLPDRIQVSENWQASYLIAPGAVRSPNDLEFTASDELVVLQQRNWGLISLTSEGESTWYLDTKDTLNELVTNGMLDRDMEGNLYLMHNQHVFLVDQPGSARELFPLTDHFSGVAQSPLDGMLYFVEQGDLKRWNGSGVEMVMENFAQSGQLVFLQDGTPFFYSWGSRQVIELIPDTWEFKQAVFNGDFTLPEISPTSFNRISTTGSSLVLSYNSEVLRIDPQTGYVELLASGFNQLEGISTASDRRICFTSRFDSGVYCWQDGVVDIASMPNFLMTPMGMAVNSRGDIYSGNDETTHLFHYDPQGHYLEAYDVNVCQAPQVDMTFDDADNLYVSAGEYFTLASSLTRVDTEGRVETLVDHPDIRYPSGIDWYDGHVYVVEAETGTLYRLEEDNSLTTILSVPASPPDNNIPMRIDHAGNFYIFITADKQMKLYQVAPENEWTQINTGVNLQELVTLEYWEDKHALLLGFTGFWDETGKVLLYDIETGQTQTLISGLHAASGLAVTPDGSILINDDWDNGMILLEHVRD